MRAQDEDAFDVACPARTCYQGNETGIIIAISIFEQFELLEDPDYADSD
jgi:hypothetical protein